MLKINLQRGQFWKQAPEMLKISLQERPGGYFGSMPQKCSNSASRSVLRAILGELPEMIKISLRRRLERHFGSRPQK